LTAFNRIVSLGLRVLGAVFGGYALTALAVSTAGAVMARLGLTRSEAVVLAAMAGFLIYLGLLLWAFSVQSLARLWAALLAWAVLLMLLLQCVK
jgi:hypothetical protein